MTDVVYYFSATWCAPCRVVSPNIEALAHRYPTVEFHKIDVEEEAALADKYHIKAMPTIVRVQNGVEIARVVGVKTREDLARELKLA